MIEKDVQGYALGFSFTEDKRLVALIRKNRPDWQAGKFNGVGGHVEVGETPRYAMVREFEEETGVLTEECEWDHECTFVWAGDETREAFNLFIYRRISDDTMNVQRKTDEMVFVMPVKDVHDLTVPILPKLRWLIPFCLNGQMAHGQGVIFTLASPHPEA